MLRAVAWDIEDLARFVLDPAARAETPPRALSACSSFSIQTSLSGSFNIRFAPAKSNLTDLAQRRVSNSSEQQITIAGDWAPVQRHDLPFFQRGQPVSGIVNCGYSNLGDLAHDLEVWRLGKTSDAGRGGWALRRMRSNDSTS